MATVITVFLFLACDTGHQEILNPKDPGTFAGEDYFKQEIERLQKLNPTISKTVSKEGVTESKALQIKNWSDELSSFSNLAYKSLNQEENFQQLSTDSMLTFRATNDKPEIREVSLVKNAQGKIISIRILKEVHNILYNTIEQFEYRPDSVYRIQKEQNVRLLGRTSYSIIGKF